MYHKFNGIIAMKKHVDCDHPTLMKRLAKHPNYIVVAKAPTNRNTNKKGHMSFHLKFLGLISNKFKKDEPTRGFLG
jgi:hypothetical protein